jgi:hypothetical protein
VRPGKADRGGTTRGPGTGGRAWARACAGALALALFAGVLPLLPAVAEGPNAIMTPTGYNANSMARGDNNSLLVTMPFSVNWGGTNFTQIYINTNGNCTFGIVNDVKGPKKPLAQSERDILSPLWTDIDTRNTAAGQITYSSATSPPLVGGRPAFFVNWINVAPTNQQATPLNSFQIVIVDRADTGAGNFDFYFNYDKVTWDWVNTHEGYRARAGWAWADGGASYEMAGSGVAAGQPSQLLDTSSPATSLIQNYLNETGQLGRYIWRVRGGLQPNLPPVLNVVSRVFEGNAAGGYSGYDPLTDVTASDPEGGAITLSRSPTSSPNPLPLGTTTIRWTATDTGYPLGTPGNAASTSATQTVLVRDTTPPTTPVVSSSTHTAGAWSTIGTATVSWTSTDVCAGIGGYSYTWTQGATGTPDVTTETVAATLTAPLADGTWYFNVRAVDRAGNASGTGSIGPFWIDRAAPTTSDNAPHGWTNANPVVTLTAADPAPGVVSWTRYSVDGSAESAYGAPLLISGDGAHSLRYRSSDAAGNVETTVTVAVLIDTGAPTTPTGVDATAVDSSTIAVSWSASTDSVSGVAFYRVYQDGSLVATTASTAWDATGLDAGQTCSFYIVAVDAAGNPSAPSVAVAESTPLASLQLDISNPAVDFASLVPGTPTTIADATTVSVTGMGPVGYQLSCAAADFAGPGALTMPVGVLRFQTRGYRTLADTAFTNAALVIDTSSGVLPMWTNDYIIDLTMSVPWTSDPEAYSTTIVYTLVSN